MQASLQILRDVLCRKRQLGLVFREVLLTIYRPVLLPR